MKPYTIRSLITSTILSTSLAAATNYIPLPVTTTAMLLTEVGAPAAVHVLLVEKDKPQARLSVDVLRAEHSPQTHAARDDAASIKRASEHEQASAISHRDTDVTDDTPADKPARIAGLHAGDASELAE